MLRYIHEGGPAMVWISIVGVGLLPSALALLVFGRGRPRVAAGLLVALSVIVIGLGYYGYAHGNSLGKRGAALAPPDQAAMFLAESEREASYPLKYGALVGGTALLLTGLGYWRAQRRQ